MKCTTTPYKSSTDILAATSNTSSNQALVQTALDLQREIFVAIPTWPGLLLVSSCIALSIHRLMARAKDKQVSAGQPTRLDHHIRQITIAIHILVWSSASIILACACSTESSLSALHVATGKSGNLKIKTGVTVKAMQWTIFSLTTVFGFRVMLTLRSHTRNIPMQASTAKTPAMDW